MYCKLITFYNTLAISVYKHKVSTFRNMPCDVPVLFSEMYYSHMYFYSNYNTQKLQLSPLPWVYRKFYLHPCGILPWLLSPFPREYRRYCPHYHGNYRDITAIPSPCHSLCQTLNIS